MDVLRCRIGWQQRALTMMDQQQSAIITIPTPPRSSRRLCITEHPPLLCSLSPTRDYFVRYIFDQRCSCKSRPTFAARIELDRLELELEWPCFLQGAWKISTARSAAGRVSISNLSVYSSPRRGKLPPAQRVRQDAREYTILVQ
jgi:hypothetical protein